MDVRDKVVVVTGAAGGIGRTLCARFADEGANVVVSDRELVCAREVSDAIGGIAVACDVSDEADVRNLVDVAIDEFEQVNVFVSNAGVTAKGGVEVPDDDWQACWDVHVMAHVYASRAVLPHMLARGSGYLVNVASAAGLLTEIGSAPYSATKHAAVALAEWLSVQHHADGVRSSCVCPMGVATEFLDEEDPVHQFLAVTAVTPDDVAEAVVRGLEDERFLILPHPDVEEFFARKGEDYERYLKGFRRLKQKLERQPTARSRWTVARTGSLSSGRGSG